MRCLAVLCIGPIVCVALLLAPGAARAQELGIRGGLTLANVNVSEPGQLPAELQWCCSPWDGARRDVAAGLFAGWNLRPGVAVDAELLFARRGFDIGRNERSPAARLRMSYLEAPVLLQYVGGLVRVYAGPAVAVRVGTSQWSNRRLGDFVDRGTLAKVDVSLVIGASLHRGRLSLDGRYAQGLRNVIRDAPGGAGLRHKSLMLLLGVRVAGDGCTCEDPPTPVPPWRR